jgi:hypothetical protein
VITDALVDVILEARASVPTREAAEGGETYTYSTDTGGGEEESDERRRRRRPRRKRRPKPEAIAARLKGDAAPAEGAVEGGGEVEGAAEG